MTTLSPIPITKRLLPGPRTECLPLLNSPPSSSPVVLFLLLMLLGTGLGQNTTEVNVGVVLDTDTLVGKVGLTSISLALSDFYASHPSYLTRIKLISRDSRSDDVAAAAAALDLIKNHRVQAIIGPQRSTQADFIIDLGDKANVPIVTFSATSPFLSTVWHPFFVRATEDDSSQVNAIGALVRAYGWREAVLVYVDNEFGQGLVPSLTDALEQVDSKVTYRSAVSPSATDDQILAELYKLATMQTRVFIVHMNLALGSRLFSKANEAGMMSPGYVWIVTNGMADLFSLIDGRVVSTAMQGVLGVKTHIPDTPTLDDFIARWKTKFRQDYPSIMDPTMNVFGLRAYDAAVALAVAVEKVGASNYTFLNPGNSTNSTSDLETLGVSGNGEVLIQAIMNATGPGLAGNFSLVNRQLQSSAFEIVNVNGNALRKIGFWTKRDGLLKDLVAANMTASGAYSTSRINLGTIIWPGDPSEVPKGWEIPTSEPKLRILVPVKDGFNQFVTVTRDPDTNETQVTGYCIDIFKAVMGKLPYYVPLELVPYANPDGTPAGDYNDMIEQVYLQRYDAVVGDTTIIANRSLYVDFTLPYTESGVLMIVPYINSRRNNGWVFLKPLTLGLWLTAFIFFVIIGLVVWTLEHRINEDFRGPASHQVGTSFWFSFSTMVFAQRERLVSNLARFVIIVWVFVVLILTQSYTASLSSLLVIQNSQPSITDINELLKSDLKVGYQEGSFVHGLLKEMKFDEARLISYGSPEECDRLLSKGSANGGIAAAVDEAPYVKLLLSKTCNKYTTISTLQTAGFGFAFPRGSPLVPDISRAILNVTEGPEMTEIENAWFPQTSSCQASMASVSSSSNKLSVWNFWGLFAMAGGVSLFALFLSIAIFVKSNWHISSGNSFKEKMVDLIRRFFQRDLNSHTFRQVVPCPDSVPDGAHETRIDIISDTDNSPRSLTQQNTWTDNAPGEEGTQVVDHDAHTDTTEERVPTDQVMNVELSRVNPENSPT